MVCCVCSSHHAQRVTIYICIITKHIACDYSIFFPRECIIYSHRRIISRGDGQRNCGRVCSTIPIIDCVDKAICPVVIFFRCISKRAISSNTHRTVIGRISSSHHAQHVSIYVTICTVSVIRKNVPSDNDIFTTGESIICSYRRTISSAHSKCNGSTIRAAIIVFKRIGKTVLPTKTCRGHIGK